MKSLRLADQAVPNIEFLVGGGEAGSDVVGLLGQNVLHLADVEYDLGHGVVRLLRPRDCGREDLAYWAAGRPYSAIRLFPGLTRVSFAIATVSINGAPVRALFDTGASSSVLSLAAARRVGVPTTGAGVEAAATRACGSGTSP